tara:strand:+ start:2831 stop:3079 length:249 start_codon:yes stop_codon:yes gene_type:complete
MVHAKNIWMGHVLTICFAVIAAATSYGALSNRVSELENRINTLEDSLMPMLRTLERDINEVKVKVAEIGVDVRWLKSPEKEK